MEKFSELNMRQSTWNKVEDDEMVFILRAQDITAPKIVLEWIKANFENVSEAKLMEAFNCALAMKRFNHRKKPD